MFSSTSFMGSLKKIWVSGPLDTYSNVWCQVWLFFIFFSKSLSSCLKITYLKSIVSQRSWDATFTIHQISICIWANFWTSYSASLLCLAIHAPNYTILIAGALWYVLISSRTYPHHTAFLFQFFCLFLFHINFSINSRKNKTQPIFSIFVKIMLNGYINIYLGHTEHVILNFGYLWDSVLGWIMFRPKICLSPNPHFRMWPYLETRPSLR